MQEGVFDVYTDVAAHVKWINDTILSMGGMQSCGYTLEKILSEDEDGDYAVDNDDDIYIMMKCLSVCLSRKMITSS